MITPFQALIISLFGLMVIGIIYFLISTYNRLVTLQNNFDKAWANINVLLKQRSDEITNLTNTVKDYMKYEKQLIENVTKARSFLNDADSLSKKAAVNDFITESLKTIFATAEKYPDLKAIDTFKHLQERVTGLENELADRREFYNDSVTVYNTRIKSFPDLLVAKIMKCKKSELFKASEEDKKYIKVMF